MLQHFVEHFLKTAGQKAVEYHVDPKIFAILYAVHYLLLWSTVAWTVVVFRRGKDITSWLSLAAFFLILPWFYPLFFGKLPWYFDAGLVIAMVVIAWHGYHKVQKQVRERAARHQQHVSVAAEKTA